MQSENSSRPSLVRPVILLVVLSAALYGATWVGPVAFLFAFQNRFEEGDRTGIVWASATDISPVEFVSVSDGETTRTVRESEGRHFPLPHGELLEFESHGTAAFATYQSGKISYGWFERNLVIKILDTEIEAVNAPPREGDDPVEWLERLSRVTPKDYEFDLPESERQGYAAKLLSKMLLWEERPVERFEWGKTADGQAAGVYTEYVDGTGMVVSLSSHGTLVVRFSDDAPEDWRHLELWLVP